MNEYVGRTVRLVPGADFFTDEIKLYLNATNATIASGELVSRIEKNFVLFFFFFNLLYFLQIFAQLKISGHLWINSVALVGFAVLYHIIAYLAMAFFVTN